MIQIKYLVHHTTDGEKSSIFHTDEAFLAFAKLIAKENGDPPPRSAAGAAGYIYRFCDNLELHENLELYTKEEVEKAIYACMSKNDYFMYKDKMSVSDYIKKWVEDNSPFSS